MVNPQILQGSSSVRNTGTSATLSPAEDKTQHFTISNFTADVSEGEDYTQSVWNAFIQSVQNAFGGVGKQAFLDDQAISGNDTNQSQHPCFHFWKCGAELHSVYAREREQLRCPVGYYYYEALLQRKYPH